MLKLFSFSLIPALILLAGCSGFNNGSLEDSSQSYSEPIEYSEELIEYTEIDDGERELLSKIQGVNQSFYYVSDVRRHYIMHEDTNTRTSVFVEMIFDDEDPGYPARHDGGVYVYYKVSWEPNPSTVRVGFSVGSASTGERIYTVLDDDVFATDRSCGTSACSVTFARNDQEIESFLWEHGYNNHLLQN